MITLEDIKSLGDEYLFVRLKPYNKAKGHVMRKFVAHGNHFRVEDGWYAVGHKAAEYLGTVHQDAYNEDSPFAFDVCTKEEVIRMETQKFEEKRKVEMPNFNEVAIHRVGKKKTQLPAKDAFAPAELPEAPVDALGDPVEEAGWDKLEKEHAVDAKPATPAKKRRRRRNPS